MRVLRSVFFCLFIAGVQNAPQEGLPENDFMHFEVILDNMMPCPDSPEPKVTITDITLEFFNRTQLLVNGFFIVKEKVDDIQTNLELMKCDSKQQVDSCQHVLSTTVDDICEKLPKTDTSWEPFVLKMKGFERKCPIVPGNYPIEGAPVDTSTFNDNPVMYGFWIIDAKLMNGEEYLGCTRVSASIVKKRRKGGIV